MKVKLVQAVSSSRYSTLEEYTTLQNINFMYAELHKYYLKMIEELLGFMLVTEKTSVGQEYDFMIRLMERNNSSKAQTIKGIEETITIHVMEVASQFLSGIQKDIMDIETATNEHFSKYSKEVIRIDNLKNSSKKPEEVLRKLHNFQMGNDIDIENNIHLLTLARLNLQDVIRFTFVINERFFKDAFDFVHEQMIRKGYNLHSVDNTFGKIGNYQALHTKWLKPEMGIFEIQFHTQRSLDTRNETEPQYEVLKNAKSHSTEEIHKARHEISQIYTKDLTPSSMRNQ